jgi:hypothetical protein
MRHQAIYSTHPTVTMIDGGLGAFDRDGNKVEIQESLVASELAKLRAAEPLRLLRVERDRLLAETDWWASSDLTMSAKRKSYRQALRDLPASASPSLDESGQLTGITWPTKPK